MEPFIPSISTQNGTESSHFPSTHGMTSLPFKAYPGSQIYSATRPSSNKITSPFSGATGSGHELFGWPQYTEKEK